MALQKDVINPQTQLLVEDAYCVIDFVQVDKFNKYAFYNITIYESQNVRNTAKATKQCSMLNSQTYYILSSNFDTYFSATELSEVDIYAAAYAHAKTLTDWLDAVDC